MKPYPLTLHGLLSVAVLATGFAGHSTAATPNIVFILADDLGYGDVMCNNSKSLIPTPNIDKLAAQGRRFTEAHTPASVCSPTRYALLTGRYAWRTSMKEGVLYDFDPALIKKGRMTALLDELKIAQDTLVIFTSDNGSIHYPANETLGHTPGIDRRGYKTDIWDGGTHVPFIARWPGQIPAGTTSGELICLVDMLATFAAITGQALPDWQAEDSFNVLPALTGKGPGRSELITHSYTGVFAIRQDGWKLILGTKGSGGHQGITPEWQPNQTGFDRPGKIDIGQLYHIASDAGETKDLWAEQPETVKRLSDRLDLLLRHGRSQHSP